jgi:hypothetical protein
LSQPFNKVLLKWIKWRDKAIYLMYYSPTLEIDIFEMEVDFPLDLLSLGGCLFWTR